MRTTLLPLAFLLCFCAQSVSAQRPHTLTGIFRTHTAFHSRYLSRDRDILIYLPPDYETNLRRRYPVLYMHDGQNLFDGATSFIPGKEWRLDETAESLIRAGAIEPLIIVGIYNGQEKRIDEYTPTVDAHYKAGGEADAYGKMLTEELKPFIDSHYRTKKGRADTGLGGSSLGGLVSLYLGLKHPRVFGKLAVMSPSVWWDNRMILRDIQALSRRPKLRIWLDIGTAEGDTATPDAEALRDALIARGWKLGHDLEFMEVTGAHHNEDAWAARAEPMLRFLFPNPHPPSP